jgi:hypothetical protein
MTGIALRHFLNLGHFFISQSRKRTHQNSRAVPSEHLGGYGIVPARSVKKQAARLDVENLLQFDDGFISRQTTLLVNQAGQESGGNTDAPANIAQG